MTDAVGGAVAAVVHNQCAVAHLLLDEPLGIGEAGAGGAADALVGIPVDLLDVEIGVVAGYDVVGHSVGLEHVDVALAVVAVVAYEADDVLPVTTVVVPTVAYNLVDHHLSLGERACWKTADTDVGQVAACQADALALVEHAEEVVADVALSGAERVLALEAEQEIVGRQADPVGAGHAVVPGAVAEEQQVAWHVGLGCGSVGEHLQVSAVGIGIGGAAGKLIEQLVGRDDAHAQRVHRFVKLLKTLCLCYKVLGSGDDNHQVGRAVGVMVLVGDAVDVLRCGQRCRAQVGKRHRLVERQLHVVESHVGRTRSLSQLYTVVGLHQTVDSIGLLALDSRGVLTRRQRVGDGPQERVVQCDAYLAGTVARQDDAEPSATVVARKLLIAWLISADGRALEEVATAVVPGVVVDLVERVVVGSGGVE